MAATSIATKPVLEILPLEEQIRLRSYEIYIQRGNESGSQIDDWLQAEREVLIAREQTDEPGS